MGSAALKNGTQKKKIQTHSMNCKWGEKLHEKEKKNINDINACTLETNLCAKVEKKRRWKIPKRTRVKRAFPNKQNAKNKKENCTLTVAAATTTTVHCTVCNRWKSFEKNATLHIKLEAQEASCDVKKETEDEHKKWQMKWRLQMKWRMYKMSQNVRRNAKERRSSWTEFCIAIMPLWVARWVAVLTKHDDDDDDLIYGNQLNYFFFFCFILSLSSCLSVQELLFHHVFMLLFSLFMFTEFNASAHILLIQKNRIFFLHFESHPFSYA